MTPVEDDMIEKPIQRYLITVEAMNTSDECDCVVRASFLTDGAKLPVVKVLDLIKPLHKALAATPLTNVRPMTLDEIQEYRNAERDAENERDDTATVLLTK